MINDKERYLADVKASADYIKERIPESYTPEILIVLGSGLGPLASDVEGSVSIPYTEIPGFPRSTVPGHEGKLLIGKLCGKDVFMMSGRFHYYEGYDTSVVTFYVRVMSLLGVKSMILTNAAGGIGEGMHPGCLMAINDHISFFCESPLRGPNLDDFGPRFPDQSNVYDPEYLDIMNRCAEELGIELFNGIYAFCRGPQYETPAEIQVLKLLGAGSVGMSTVPEAIVASHCGMRVSAISCVTNLAAGLSGAPLNHLEVMENAAKVSSACCALVKRFITNI